MENAQRFDELQFFAQVKKRPGAWLGRPSLLSLRDQLFGMRYAFDLCGQKNALKYFFSFVKWYEAGQVGNENGFACWWDHMLYISGNNDEQAFDTFFRCFEGYLEEHHGIALPEAAW